MFPFYLNCYITIRNLPLLTPENAENDGFISYYNYTNKLGIF